MTTPNEPNAPKSPEELERDIEATRAAIGEDLEALGTKFSPEGLKREAKDAIHGAAGAAAESAHELAHRAAEGASALRHRVGRASASGARFAAQHAGPLALMGMGAGWLMLSLREERRPGAARFPERTSWPDVQTRARDKLADAAQVRREAGQKVREHVGEFAAAALVLGLGAGLLLPDTQVEAQLVGDARGRVRAQTREAVAQGRATVDQLREGARQSLEEAKSILR
jgi:hypothetical protein